MLPEIFMQAVDGGMLYLLEIREADSILELDLGEVPAVIDSNFSIVPHSFLSTQSWN
jgi:hypothetical protein